MTRARTVVTRQQAEALQKVVGLMVRRESLNIEAKSLDDEGTFIGYASTFETVPDLQGDVVSPLAFDATIADWRSRGSWPPLLWNHDTSTPSSSLGAITHLRTDHRGLVIEGRLDLAHEPAKAVYAAMKSGRIKTFSISYAVIKQHREYNWNVLDEVALLEISVVSSPANRNAMLTGLKVARRGSPIAPANTRHRCRDGHPLAAPRVLASGTHPAAACETCGRICVWAPASTSDWEVRAEIKSISASLARRERARLNAVRDRHEPLHRRTVHERDAVGELRYYQQVLDELGVR
jgi:HK97 family phage prohead protease